MPARMNPNVNDGSRPDPERIARDQERSAQMHEAEIADQLGEIGTPAELAGYLHGGLGARVGVGEANPAELARYMPGGDAYSGAALLPAPAPPARQSSNLESLDSWTWRTRLDALLEREGWETVGTPTKVETAWAEVHAAVSAAQDAAEAVHQVSADRRAAEAAEAAEIRSAAAGGNPSPKARPEVDWSAAERRADAHACGLRDRAIGKRAAYDALVGAAIEAGWLTHLASAVPDAHNAAASALVQAQQALDQLLIAIEAAVHAGLAQGQEPARLAPLHEAQTALAKAREVLGQFDSSKPVTRPRLTPSEAERHAMVMSGDPRSIRFVQRQEISEDWRWTQLTRNLVVPDPGNEPGSW